MAKKIHVKKDHKVVKAAVVGTLAGAALGLLLAPKSGKELRQDLIENAHILGDKAVAIGGKAQDVLHNIEVKTESEVQTIQTTGKKWFQKGKQLVSGLKTLVSDIRKGTGAKTVSINAAELKDVSDSKEEN